MTLFSIPAESIPGSMFGANLVISAQTCEELLRGQTEFPRKSLVCLLTGCVP